MCSNSPRKLVLFMYHYVDNCYDDSIIMLTNICQPLPRMRLRSALGVSGAWHRCARAPHAGLSDSQCRTCDARSACSAERRHRCLSPPAGHGADECTIHEVPEQAPHDHRHVTAGEHSSTHHGHDSQLCH